MHCEADSLPTYAGKCGKPAKTLRGRDEKCAVNAENLRFRSNDVLKEREMADEGSR